MEDQKIRVGIVGVSGYTGKETLALLLKHAGVRVTYVAARRTGGAVSAIYPEFLNRTTLVCEKFSLTKAAKRCEVVFLALPHTESMAVAGKLLAQNVKVIDLSADYRLKKPSLYQAWYGQAHTDAGNIARAVYGLPELYRAKIRKARLIANPGCYPTAAILGLAPLAATRPDILSIIIDGKSGVSGAGRKAVLPLLQAEVNENFKAYKVLAHQHAPEIDQALSALAGRLLTAHFVAHLLPINRGILNTMYVQLQEPADPAKLHQLYTKFYKAEPFVRVLPMGDQPEVKNAVYTNFCDVGLAVAADSRTVVITCVIDNLVKGAAGQAVQNMNIIFGLKETEGLI